MKINVEDQLLLKKDLPSGSKKRSRRSKNSKKSLSEPIVKFEEPVKVPAKSVAAEFDVEVAQDIVFEPNPGPQTEFLSSSEREVLYGGAAGGGVGGGSDGGVGGGREGGGMTGVGGENGGADGDGAAGPCKSRNGDAAGATQPLGPPPRRRAPRLAAGRPRRCRSAGAEGELLGR